MTGPPGAPGAPGAPGGPPRRPEAALAIIRIAMLTGVLMFGAVVWLLQRARPAEPLDPGLAPFGRALPVVVGAAMLVVLALRLATARADAARSRALTVVGWGVGEFAALAGGAWLLLTRDPQWYVVGVLVLVASYVVLPIRKAG